MKLETFVTPFTKRQKLSPKQMQEAANNGNWRLLLIKNHSQAFFLPHLKSCCFTPFPSFTCKDINLQNKDCAFFLWINYFKYNGATLYSTITKNLDAQNQFVTLTQVSCLCISICALQSEAQWHISCRVSSAFITSSSSYTHPQCSWSHHCAPSH